MPKQAKYRIHLFDPHIWFSMIQQVDETSVVLVGKWNPAILTSDWLKVHVFDNAEDFKCEMYFPINDTSLPIKINLEHVELFADPIHLVAKPKAGGKDSFKHCFEVMRLIIEKLQHTPLLALGINVSFVDKDGDDKFAGLVELNDSKVIDADTYALKNTNIIRSYLLTKEQYTLNYAINYGAKEVAVKLNFDKQTNSFDEVFAQLDPDTSDNWFDKALEFIQPTFGDIEETTEDH